MVISSVSFLGSSQAQNTRLKSLAALMDDLQRQAVTQKKADDFAGLGLNANSIQDSRVQKNRLESYKDNINVATTRVKVMSQSMQRMTDLGRDLRAALQTQFRPSTSDMETVQLIAKQALAFFEDMVNTKIDGKYLFAGNNSDIPPMANFFEADSNIQAEVQNWLVGGITTAQFTAGTNALTPTQLGFDSQMSSSGSVAIRVDDATEVDITSIATKNGFQDMLRALTVAANLTIPGPTDVPTSDDFNTVLDNLLSTVDSAVTQIDSANTVLGNRFDLMTRTATNHQEDINLFDSIINNVEGVDTTEIFIKIQSLQTQLSASYQVTSMTSKLSLANYL